ncbi:hypothetical protein NDU88_002271 [Pleurodeles waltl]|uniref:Uncharacterized protein n=1 Tax=Pleurodeles waltl TaxID=8319 RepID=A0AAV7SC75_PLEWA|nr:hypothetical protein NDU88_002271 [Pleurodeles waltl]
MLPAAALHGADLRVPRGTWRAPGVALTERRLDSGGDGIVAGALRQGGGGEEDRSENWCGGALTGYREYSSLPDVGHWRDS